MTTIAFDGFTMAADTLCTDYYGMVEISPHKIKVGKDFLCGGAGETAQIEIWWAKVKSLPLGDVLIYGYPDYKKDDNDPAIMLAGHDGVYRHTGGIFLKCSRSYHAIGSGRDYALSALYLKKDAVTAVMCAAHFDNGTNSDVKSEKLPGVSDNDRRSR